MDLNSTGLKFFEDRMRIEGSSSSQMEGGGFEKWPLSTEKPELWPSVEIDYDVASQIPISWCTTTMGPTNGVSGLGSSCHAVRVNAVGIFDFSIVKVILGATLGASKN